MRSVIRSVTRAATRTGPDGFIRKVEIKEGCRFTSDLYIMYQQTESLDTLVNEYILGIKFGFFF